jgi:protein-tyrosine-phosphatase
MPDIRLLFVCSGNVFRSMAAEYCIKKYLHDNGIRHIHVSSAGTAADSQPVMRKVAQVLGELGIDVSGHKQTVLTKKLLESQDIIIAMSIKHRDFMQKEFGISAELFNQAAYGKATSVDDINEALAPDAGEEKVNAHIEHTIKHINGGMPGLFRFIIAAVC